MKFDKLDAIFNLQGGFDNRLAAERADYNDASEWVQRGVWQCCLSLQELLDATRNWKWWKNPEPIDREPRRARGHPAFLVSMPKGRFTPDDIFNAYALRTLRITPDRTV